MVPVVRARVTELTSLAIFVFNAILSDVRCLLKSTSINLKGNYTRAHRRSLCLLSDHRLYMMLLSPISFGLLF